MSRVELKQEQYSFGGVDYLICELQDSNQFDEHDLEASRLGISSATWPLFGIVWPAAQVLVGQVIPMDLQGKRVLEIGCGIGLASIVLHGMGVDITASDYHPQVLPYLQRNLLQNLMPPMKYETGNWETGNPELGSFDLIIGSDILYQPVHVDIVSRFISVHSGSDVDVMIIDPGRENRSKFTQAMQLLGFDHRFEKFDQSLPGTGNCRGRVLHYHRGQSTLPQGDGSRV